MPEPSDQQVKDRERLEVDLLQTRQALYRLHLTLDRQSTLDGRRQQLEVERDELSERSRELRQQIAALSSGRTYFDPCPPEQRTLILGL